MRQPGPLSGPAWVVQVSGLYYVVMFRFTRFPHLNYIFFCLLFYIELKTTHDFAHLILQQICVV